MLALLERFDNIDEAKRQLKEAHVTNLALYNSKVNSEAHRQWGLASLQIVYNYAYLSPVQRGRLDSLRRDQIARLGLLGTLMVVPRRTPR